MSLQGPVLGLVLVTIYTLLLGNAIAKPNLSFHFYADDSQPHLYFDPSLTSRALPLTRLLPMVVG